MADFLDEILQHCNISAEHKEFIINKLFKYKNDPIAQAVCSIIQKNAQEHTKFLDIWNEIGKVPNKETTSWPLIVFTPDNATTLRVFPNILLNSHRGIENISTSTCTTQLKTFLEEYEADMADEKRKLKWEASRVSKYLGEFIDMPTARALTRYVFTDDKLKDDIIRDFADAIDNYRKPLELLFAEKPEDFTIMYGSGPQSCMAYSAGDRQSWEFMEKKYNLCPGSWYAYYPFTKGAYVVKAGKVLARAILFERHKGQWQYGRVYATTPENDKKFKETLAFNHIKPLITSHTPPTNLEFKIPGVIKSGGVYACPWPYFDNISREDRAWTIEFNKNTHEWTIRWRSSTGNPINNRSGHLISTDYITMECSTCGKHLSPKHQPIIPVELGEHVFCSDNCAANMEYHKVVEGTGAATYKKVTEAMVPLHDDRFVYFSTAKAAKDLGYLPLVEELGIFPEENAVAVTNIGDHTLKDAMGNAYFVRNPMRSILNLNYSNRVPIIVNAMKKEVSYNESELVVDI